MTNQHKPPTFRGRSLGIVILTVAQLLIGAIHVFFGSLLLIFENFASLQATVAYDVYTVVFGGLVLVFAVSIWQGKKTGWIGMVAVSLFVIIVDSLTLLGLPSIPGVPKLPALTEIAYSVVVVAYLFLGHVRVKFLG